MDTDHMIVVRAAKACGEDLIEKDLLDYFYF